MDLDSDLHPIEALAISTDEVVPLGLVERYEIFATAPIPHSTLSCAVVIPSLVHLKHIVLILLVPKCCGKECILNF